MFAKILILLFYIPFNIEYFSDVIKLFLALENVMSSHIFLLWGSLMGECIIDYKLEVEILISIVDCIVVIILFACWSLLLSTSCEVFVKNDITLLLLGAYSYGMNTSLMIIAGIEKLEILTCIYYHLQ